MRKCLKVSGYAAGSLLALLIILILADSIYGFCTANHAPIYVDHKASYIKSVSQENDSLKCTVVLRIKNIRYEQIDCNKIRLLLWGKNGDPEQFETVDAEPKDPASDYISFPGLRSKLIECTFLVRGFGAPLSIDNIDISSLSYKQTNHNSAHNISQQYCTTAISRRKSS